MKKSFRNLVLSLLLAAGAAGLAACEGERGPVGEAGPTGVAGAAGPKGAAGDPGKSSDDIPGAYEFLKNWGKADGMAACNDDFFKKTESFPGPTGKTVPLPSAFLKVPIPSGNNTSVTMQVNIGDADGPNTANKGKCSDEVFAVTAGTGNNRTGTFIFTPTRSGERERGTRTGTTAVLRNPTLTAIKREFWSGTFSVDMKAEAAAAEGTDRLAVRCDGRKRPADVTGGKRITGEYRIAIIEEDEDILEKDSGGTNRIKDSHPTTTANDYHVKTFTMHACIRLDSVPGTVKCLVKTSTIERDSANDDKKKNLLSPVKVVTEHIALYKGGQLMQVMPMPYSNSKLAGTPVPVTPPATPESFPFTASNYDDASIPPGKLCNFFDKGVIPCPDGEVPGNDGACAAPSP